MASRFLSPITRALSPITRSSRSDPLMDLHREVNRLFEDLFNVDPFGGSTQGGLMSMPRLDVRESDKDLCISAELPGVKRSEVDVRLEGDVLTITGEKKNEVDQKKENFHVTERSFGRFERSVQLPFTPDPEQVRAEFQDGVLNVRLQKRPEAQRGRRIEVQEGAGGQQQGIEHSSGQQHMPNGPEAGDMQRGQSGSESEQRQH